MSSETATETTQETSEYVDDEDLLDLEIKAMYGGAGVTIVAAFLPWYSILGSSVLGIEGDGIITLILSFLAIGLIWYFDNLNRQVYAGIGLGALITFIGLYHLTNFSGAGVYLTIIGGVILIGGGVSGYRKI